ncbi:MAG: hypothetical protein M3Y56_01395 [Armatimonadota bacterium]|nr:hypothetical protein [Armatimonadota bacterium]
MTIASRRNRRLLTRVASIAGIAGAVAAPLTPAMAAKGIHNKPHKIRLAPVALPRLGTRRLADPTKNKPRPGDNRSRSTSGTGRFEATAEAYDGNLPDGRGATMGVLATTTSTAPTIDAKLLVISADGNETTLPAITQELNYLGTPYTLWITTQHPGGLTPAVLGSGTHAFYQGVILTNADLSYSPDGGTTWQSGLTTPEWAALASFEQSFNIRQVNWYAYPTAEEGLSTPTAVDTTTAPISAQFTTAAQSVFPYVNTTSGLTISNAYTYLSQPLDSSAVPLLVDTQGNALAVIHTGSDGREALTMTFDTNPYLVHDIVLSYGIINWVTRGLFLGDRHTYLAAQPDDFFIEDDIWIGPNVTPDVYRITGQDLTTFIAWQNKVQSQPTTKGFVLDLPFNGVGASPGEYDNDTLTPTAKTYQSKFRWLSHTWDHSNLDAINYADTTWELQQNDGAARRMKFSNYTKHYMITPDVSGLTNPLFLQAAYAFGIRFLVSDTSQPGQNNPSPNTGIINAVNPGIFEVPRYPTNLYYNVSQPSEWVSEYNSIYGAYWGRNLSYSEILDKESQVMLAYMLMGNMNPLMFHQPNLRAYDGVHSLLGDLMDRTFAKYNAIYKLPIVDLTLDKIGQRMASRMQYNAAGVTASYVPGKSITLTAQKAVTVPVTGLSVTGAEVYGGQSIASINIAAGKSVTIPLPATP